MNPGVACRTGTATQPPTTANYPGLPQECTPAGLANAIAVVTALEVPRIWLRLSVSVANRRAIPGLAAADVESVTR